MPTPRHLLSAFSPTFSATCKKTAADANESSTIASHGSRCAAKINGEMMTELFFPYHCCTLDRIVGNAPAAINHFRLYNGPGRQLFPENFYYISSKQSECRTIVTELEFLNHIERRNLYHCVMEFGEATLALAIFHQEHLSKITRRSTGLAGAGATAAGSRMSSFGSAVRNYENALFALHDFNHRRSGSGAERAQLEQTVKIRYNQLNQKFQVEMARIVPRADIGKNRGTALTSSERGIELTRHSKGRGLHVTDQIQAGGLVKFSRAIRFVGNGAVVLDAGLRANNVRRTHHAGGDWMRETSVQLTGFGLGGAVGSFMGKNTVIGGAMLVAKMGLALTPAGWVVLIGAGVAVGFAAGYGFDRLGQTLSSYIWDRGW